MTARTADAGHTVRTPALARDPRRRRVAATAGAFAPPRRGSRTPGASPGTASGRSPFAGAGGGAPPACGRACLSPLGPTSGGLARGSPDRRLVLVRPHLGAEEAQQWDAQFARQGLDQPHAGLPAPGLDVGEVARGAVDGSGQVDEADLAVATDRSERFGIDPHGCRS